LQQYIGANALAKDQQNGALMKMMKDSQYNLIGFKEFNPRTVTRDKSLEYWNSDENGDFLKSRKKK
jgi:DNA primase